MKKTKEQEKRILINTYFAIVEMIIIWGVLITLTY